MMKLPPVRRRSRRVWEKVETIATDPETGEETATVTLHQRYIYRGYLQVAACDLTRGGGHPCLWLITWDPTQPMATRPLAIQKDGTWYCYGWDLTKNVCEVFGQAGYTRTAYAYPFLPHRSCRWGHRAVRPMLYRMGRYRAGTRFL